MPKVSVVIPTYNRGRLIVPTLQSVIAQSYRDFEIIVVDDGSTDDTSEVIASFGDEVRYIYQENQERSTARNRGIMESQGEYIAFLDSDDLWKPDKLLKQVQAAQQYSDGPRVIYCNADLVDVDGGSICPEGIVGEALAESKPSGNVYHALLGGCFVSSCEPMVPRLCFAACGLFDTSLNYSEDWDMWLRLARRYEFVYVPDILASVRVHSGNSIENEELVRQGDVHFFQKQIVENRDDPKALSILKRASVMVPSERILRKAYDLQAAHKWAASLGYFRRALLCRPALAVNPFFVKSVLRSLGGMRGVSTGSGGSN